MCVHKSTCVWIWWWGSEANARCSCVCHMYSQSLVLHAHTHPVWMCVCWLLFFSVSISWRFSVFVVWRLSSTLYTHRLRWRWNTSTHLQQRAHRFFAQYKYIYVYINATDCTWNVCIYCYWLVWLVPDSEHATRTKKFIVHEHVCVCVCIIYTRILWILNVQFIFNWTMQTLCTQNKN